MTSISATSASTYPSPLQQLQAELQAELNSGAIGSSDQGALASALTDINASLQGSSDTGASAGNANSPPGDLKSKIDNLIANEVSSGKLTSDRATELQGIFKAAFANGPGGDGGPPPADNSSSTAGSGSSDTSSANDILQQFLQSLQDSRSTASSPSYGANGSAWNGSSSDASVSALLINYRT